MMDSPTNLTLNVQRTICGIAKLPEHDARNVTHVLSLLDPGHPELDVFQTYGPHRRTVLRFHDIIDAEPGKVIPEIDHVGQILDFGRDVLSERWKAGHVLVHCHAGVSRSTAAMVSLMAQASPESDADTLFATLLGIRPKAWPNSRMIGYADRLLQRDGELLTGLRRHYGRQLRAKPAIRQLMTGLGRTAELDMAIDI